MRENSGTRKKTQRTLYSPVFVILGCALFIFFVHSGWGIFEKKRETSSINNLHQKELADLAVREASLKHDLENLETSEGMDREIRDRYRVVKEGEQLVIVVDDKPEVQNPESKGIFGFLKKWF